MRHTPKFCVVLITFLGFSACTSLTRQPASDASAQSSVTHFILIDTGEDVAANNPDFYNSVRHGYEVAKSLGRDVTVFADDGSWQFTFQPSASVLSKTLSGFSNPTYPPISSPMQSLADLNNLGSSSTFKAGDSVLIYITGHGDTPIDTQHPESSKIVLWGDNKISWDQLVNVFSVRKDVNFKIVNTTCYSGGVHALTRALPNVCSTAQTNFFEPDQDATAVLNGYFESHFSQQFWTRIQNSGDLSFGSASLAALQADNASFGLGSLSSVDFVEFVLKRGAYAYTSSDGSAWMNFFSSSSYYGAPYGFEFYNSPVPNSSAATQLIDDLTNIQSLNKTNENNVLAMLPQHYSDSISAAIDHLTNNQAQYRKMLTDHDNQINTLLAQWRSQANPETRLQIYDNIQMIERTDALTFAQYEFEHQSLRFLMNLIDFESQATQPQKDKLQQLLKCEWAAL